VLRYKFANGFVLAAFFFLALTCGISSYACCADPNLWVSSFNSNTELEQIGSFTAAQVRESGMPVPVDVTAYEFVFGFAFDKSNNLWACVNHYEVVGFKYKQLKDLKSDPSPTPDVIITGTFTDGSTLENIYTCNFDRKGNLWAIDIDTYTLNEISKRQLDAGSAEVTPPISIAFSEPSNPTYLTFDRFGNAWIVDGPDSQLAEFSADQLKSSGTKSPVVLLSDDGSGTSLSRPSQIVFDRAGNLWVPNISSNTVVEYTRAELAHSGDPTPKVKLDSAIFDFPIGAAFDSQGNLVVTNYDNDAIAKFSASQLKVSGAPVPKIVLTPTEPPINATFGPAL
jgi:hypothetical protein